MDIGLRPSPPNSEQLVAGAWKQDQKSTTGCEGGQSTPMRDIKQETAPITLSAFSQPQLAFGIELVDVGSSQV